MPLSLRLGLGEQRGGHTMLIWPAPSSILARPRRVADRLRVGLQPRHVAFREDAARVAAEAALEAGDRGVGALAECAVDEVVVVAEEDEIALDLGALVERQGAEPFAAAFVAGARADGAGERQGERDEETQSKHASEAPWNVAHTATSRSGTQLLAGRWRRILREQLSVELLGKLRGVLFGAVEHDFGVLRGLERAVDAGKVLDLAAAGAGVEALGIARLADLERRVDVDLGEGDVAGDLARQPPLVAERRDERDEDDEPGIGHQPGHFGDAADVLDARLLGEAEVLVEAVADVVAVEDVGVLALGGEALLDEVGDGRLARAGEAGEPDDRRRSGPSWRARTSRFTSKDW